MCVTRRQHMRVLRSKKTSILYFYDRHVFSRTRGVVKSLTTVQWTKKRTVWTFCIEIPNKMKNSQLTYLNYIIFLIFYVIYYQYI